MFLKTYLSVLLFRKPDSLIVVQKVTSNRLYAKTLKFLVAVRKNKTLYDIDDAEYCRNPTRTLHYFLKNCNSISVGSDMLYNYCSSFNNNVFVNTSPVSDHGYTKLNRSKKLHIGWVGDFGNGKEKTAEFSHKTSLYKLLFPALLKIEFPYKLSLIGVKNPLDIPEIEDYFSTQESIELNIPTNLSWQPDKWIYKVISEFDVGIALMIDHTFTRAKSAFKAKQYLSCGVPVIASNVGENEKFVKPGLNGFLVTDEDELINAINNIKSMKDSSYIQLSKNALEEKNCFSLRSYCEKLIESAYTLS